MLIGGGTPPFRPGAIKRTAAGHISSAHQKAGAEPERLSCFASACQVVRFCAMLWIMLFHRFSGCKNVLGNEQSRSEGATTHNRNGMDECETRDVTREAESASASCQPLSQQSFSVPTRIGARATMANPTPPAENDGHCCAALADNFRGRVSFVNHVNVRYQERRNRDIQCQCAGLMRYEREVPRVPALRGFWLAAPENASSGGRQRGDALIVRSAANTRQFPTACT